MAATRDPYVVAFVNTRETGGYEGVRTWSVFGSKAKFDKWYNEEMRRTHRVVEEGITEERALELTAQTPINSYLSAALQEATSPSGELNRLVLGMEISNIAFALRATGKGE